MHPQPLQLSPKDDIETISTELILADIQTLEKAIPRMEKEVRGKKTDAQVRAKALVTPHG